MYGIEFQFLNLQIVTHKTNKIKRQERGLILSFVNIDVMSSSVYTKNDFDRK